MGQHLPSEFTLIHSNPQHRISGFCEPNLLSSEEHTIGFGATKGLGGGLGSLISNFVLRRLRISTDLPGSPKVALKERVFGRVGEERWGRMSYKRNQRGWGTSHEQDVRGGGVFSVQEHLLGGAVGWTSVPPCPCLGLPPPGSLHGLCLLCRDATQCHGAGGHAALQKVAATAQLYSGQRVSGGLHLLPLLCLHRLHQQLLRVLRLRPPCLCPGGLPGLCSRYCWRRELEGWEGPCFRMGARGQAVGLEWTPREESRGWKFGVLLNAEVESHPEVWASPKLCFTHQCNPFCLSFLHTACIPLCLPGWVELFTLLSSHFITGLVIGWSLAFLAFERYIIICKPFGNFRFSSKHALIVVVATWIIGVGVSIPPFFGWSRWECRAVMLT